MSVYVPFRLPSDGYAENYKVKANFDFLSNKLQQLNTGTANWDFVSVGSPSSLTGGIRIYNGTNSYAVTIQPGVTTASHTYTLPLALPASDAILQVTNAGVMSWATGIRTSGNTVYFPGYTTGGILYASGLGEIAQLGFDTGKVLTSGAASYAYKSLLGTTDQITITPNAGDFTFSLPQSIATTSVPTFARVKFPDSTVLAPAITSSLTGSANYLKSGIRFEDLGTGNIRIGFTFAGTDYVTMDATNTLISNNVQIQTGHSLYMVGGTSGSVQITAPATGDTWALTLPSSNGDANQVLTTDGSGVTSWATPSGTGANTTLSNLTSPTAVNQILNMGTNGISGSDVDLALGTGTVTTTGLVTTTNQSVLGYIDVLGIANPTAPASGTVRFHAATSNGFTRFEQDNEAATNITLGRDEVFIARNTTVSNILRGQPVYISGATGNMPNIALAKADSLTTLPAIGIALDTINANTYGQVMKTGSFLSYDTSGFLAGDTLWVSGATAGTLTKTRPVSPLYAQRIGTVGVSNISIGMIVVTTAPFVGGLESGTDRDFTLAAGKNIVLTDDTTNTVTLALPAAVTSYTLTLPANRGNANQVLTTNGSGTTTWADAATGGVVHREDYIVGTAANNYTGSTTVFDLNTTYTTGDGSMLVAVDGVLQTIGATIDYVETDNNTITFNNALVSGEKVSFIWSVPTSGTDYATKALDNLGSVAINTSLVSDTDNTDDLGTSAKAWKDLYLKGSIKTGATPAITINSTGSVSHPNQVSFSVTNSAQLDDVTGDGTTYTVAFDTEVFDGGGNFAANTFTAPVTGKYQLSAVVGVFGQAAGHTYCQVRIVTSNRNYYSQAQFANTTTGVRLPLSVLADMGAGDTATVGVEVGGSTKVVDVLTNTVFTGILVA